MAANAPAENTAIPTSRHQESAGGNSTAWKVNAYTTFETAAPALVCPLQRMTAFVCDRRPPPAQRQLRCSMAIRTSSRSARLKPISAVMSLCASVMRFSPLPSMLAT